MSPERPPGHWQPHAVAAPSQRPVLPRTRPPPSKSQAEDPLERAAEMFGNPASASGRNKPAAPSSPSSPIFKKTTSSYEQLRDQISQRAKGGNAVDFYEEGVTPLLSYMFFVLHYHENLLTTEKMHQWPIIPRSKMRHYTDRIVFTRQYSLPVSKILKDEVEEILRFLLSRFGTADRPFLPVIPIGQREIVTLARSVIASRIPYREIFQHDAKAYAVPQEAMHVWELPVDHMPGPEPQANCYYCWGHGTTAEGLVGILTWAEVLDPAPRLCK